MAKLTVPSRIVITGASRGIGQATAQLLAQRGHTVILAARDAAALAQVASDIRAAHGCAEVLPLDLSDDASVEAAATQLLARGGCDVLINNAGISDQREFLVQPEVVRRDEFEVNYWGTLRMTRALLPSFIRRGSGTVVNVSSLLGAVPSCTTANYSASKAALEAFSHALRGEVSRFGVEVVVFVAPHTQTEAGNRSKFEGVRSLPVEYTATELVRALELGARYYAASPVYRAILRLARWFPEFIEEKVHASARPQLCRDPLAAAEPGRNIVKHEDQIART
ncbi:MAG: SDR family NAD(P)-dependent oxidoreductase [Polyangiales bacterium]